MRAREAAEPQPAPPHAHTQAAPPAPRHRFVRLQRNATAVAAQIQALGDGEGLTLDPSVVDGVLAGANFKVMQLLAAAFKAAGIRTRVFYDVVRGAPPRRQRGGPRPGEKGKQHPPGK